MTDINLLKDTKKADHDPGQEKDRGSRLEMSEPDKFSFKEKEGRPASSFSQWLKKIFNRQPKKNVKPRIISMKKKGGESTSEDGLNTELGNLGQRFDDVKKPPDQRRIPAAPPPAQPSPLTPQSIESLEQADKPLTTPAPTTKDIKADGAPPLTTPSPSSGSSAVSPTSVPPDDGLPPASNFDVNLLPEELIGQYEPKKKLINLAVITGLTVAAIVIVYVAMIIYESSIVARTEEVRQEAAIVNQQISSYQKERTAVVSLLQKTSLIEERLDQHIYWTQFFALLEKYTIAEVYFGSVFAGDISGQLSLTANGRDYASVAQQLLVFEAADDFVESVIINEASRAAGTEISEESVTFDVTLVLKPEIFIKPVTEETDR